MKRKTIFSAILFLICGLMITGVYSSAFAGGIKERMKSRLPVITALKAKGVIGENNRGYLQFLGGGTEQANVVNEENNDRKKVYTAIARQQGTTPDAVGKRRSFKLIKLAKPGEKFQDSNGNWQTR